MNTVSTAQNPKRQHVIPRMLLRNFQTRDEAVHAYNKPESRHFKATANNVFVQKDRYTQFRVDNNNERYEVEKHLAEIESQAAPVIDKIVKCRKTGLFPPLTEEEGDVVKLFLITLFLRTDHHADQIVPLDQYEHLFRQEFARQGDELQAWEDFQRSPEATALIREELIHDLRARVAVGLPPRISEQIEGFMNDYGLLIVMSDKEASGFILGDCGGVHVREPENNDGFRGWLPVSREVVIGLTRDPDNVNYLSLRRKDVNRINWISFVSSNVVVARRPTDMDYVLRRWEGIHN